MIKRMGAAWVRAGSVALAVLAVSLLAAPVEAKGKLKPKSAPKPSPAPVVNKPPLPSSVPDVPKVQTKLETGSRLPPLNVTLTPPRRGFFNRFFDWIFWWRRPAPVPASAPPPVAPVPASPPAVAVAPAAPATPPVVVPVALPLAAPASPVARGTIQSQEQEKEKAWEFPQVRPPKPEPVVKGYIFHLKNGRRISTIHYEDKGDQVVIPQYGGTFGLSKALIARIEVVKE